MKKLYEETHIQDIATAIREKNGATDTYKPSLMAEAIRNIVSGGGSGDIMLGNYKVVLGQITPTTTTGGGSFGIETGVYEIPKYCAIWLADRSVLEKYTQANIMIESHMAFGMLNGEITYVTNGTESAVLKTAFGAYPRYQGFDYRSHANWPMQPETYNWIAIYEV